VYPLPVRNAISLLIFDISLCAVPAFIFFRSSRIAMVFTFTQGIDPSLCSGQAFTQAVSALSFRLRSMTASAPTSAGCCVLSGCCRS